MYLTYDEYAAMAGSAPESAFRRLEAKARAELNRMTFGRVVGEDPVRENVKFCMFDLIGAIETDESMAAMAAGREVSAMSNDGVSVSFSASGSAGARSSAARYAAIARSWLSGECTACGIPLLYAGVDA